MPLSPEERQIVEFGKKNGKSKVETMQAISRFRKTNRQDEQSFLEEASQDVSETVTGFKESFSQVGEEASEAVRQTREGEIAPGQGAIRFLGAGAKAGSQAIGELVKGAVKTILPGGAEEKVRTKVQKAGQFLAQTDTVQDAVQAFESLPEEDRKDISSLLNIGAFATEVTGAGQAVNASRNAFRFSKNFLTQEVKSIDDALNVAQRVINELPDSPAKRRAIAESEAPDLTLQERFVDLDPAVKKQLQNAGPDKFQGYLNTTMTRNLDVNQPSVMEFAGDQVRGQVKEIEGILQDTGSNIGKTRQKLATVQAPRPQVERISNTFRDNLNDLDLEIVNGVIRKRSGGISPASAGDIRVLNELYQDLLTFQQSPTLENLIKLRGNFDSKIRFGKQATEVSDKVDPLSRQVRREIAEIAEDVVGPTAAADVQRYSDVIDALEELRSFTDRNAGGEYLVRTVLSGRGGEARKTIQTVKDLTGYDLMDDAVLLNVMIDRFASDTQKTLFRQQLKNAGIDTVQDLLGATRGELGAIGNLIRRILEKSINEEDVLRGAAGG